jgi:toxin ParE1/3/4
VRASRSSDEAGPREFGTLILDYHPAASAELIEAGRFYEERKAGLGQAFLDCVESSLARLQRNPMLGWLNAHGRREWPVRRFPYLIIYRIEGSTLHVLAVAHTSRKPGYWEFRDTAGG